MARTAVADDERKTIFQRFIKVKDTYNIRELKQRTISPVNTKKLYHLLRKKIV